MRKPSKKKLRDARRALDRKVDAMLARMQTPAAAAASNDLATLPLEDILKRLRVARGGKRRAHNK